jgi:outer membrane protein OmpA-like peptidoglycan-associated protein
MNRHLACVLVLMVGFSSSPVQAQVPDHCIEHPFIRPFPGSTLNPSCKHQDFNEYAFTITNPESGREDKVTAQGKYWYLRYVVYDESGSFADRSRSILEYRENYKRAALERGGSILYEREGRLTFTLPGEDGSTTWCHVYVSNGSAQELFIIEVAPMVQSMKFGPAEMKAALDADGRVQLHGILFDLDKATLQSESTEQLQHVVTLLKSYPDLRLEVQGHTDDQGEDAYNLSLSQRRAETVVSYLGLFGIDAARVSPKGFGESTPVAPNTTEEGRAKNRRVELVRMS